MIFGIYIWEFSTHWAGLWVLFIVSLYVTAHIKHKWIRRALASWPFERCTKSRPTCQLRSAQFGLQSKRVARLLLDPHSGLPRRPKSQGEFCAKIEDRGKLLLLSSPFLPIHSSPFCPFTSEAWQTTATGTETEAWIERKTRLIINISLALTETTTTTATV